MSALLLSGKSVLVTGSTSGIGLGIATQFAKAGATLMVHGLEGEDQVAPLLAKLRSFSSPKVSYTQADISSEAGCSKLVSETVSKLGNKLDILVNNAGIQYTARTEDYPSERWDAVMRINLTAPFLLSKAVLPGMYDRGWGRLVHIGSAHSMRGSVNKSAYCASKHGVLGKSA